MRLTEATLEMTQNAFQQENEADKRLLVQFSMFPVQDSAASAKEGRPIFKEVEYVMIMVPGDKQSVVHRRAEERDKFRFPKQYQAFLNKKSQETSNGTPLKAVTFLSLGQVKELEFFNVYTVEQLAEIPDAHASRFMGIQTLKQQAKDFLKAAREVAPLTAMRAELDKKENDLKAALHAIEEQGKRIKALEDALAEGE
jgi:hypothetical protein